MGDLTVLNEESESVAYLVSKDKRLAKVIQMVGEIKYAAHCEDPYPFLIHEIIEQMLSIKSGAAIYSRLAKLCNGSVTPEAIHALSDTEIRGIGTANSKVSYIRAVTDAVMSGYLNFDELKSLSDQEVIKKMTSIKGIGTWTAKMYLIFVLDRQDILPYEDGAFLQSYSWMYKTDDKSKQAVEKKCKKWKPYSSIAARFLYKALDLGYVKQPFHLYKEG